MRRHLPGGDVDLATVIGSVRLPSPVMTASGTAGHGAELGAYFDLSTIGAVVVKSLSHEPWPGNPSPRVCAVPGGMLNGVGLQGPGVAAWIEHELPALEASGARVVASIWGRRIDDYARAASLLADAPACVVAVEVNVSCPNLEDRSRMFAHSAEATGAAVAATAACRRPRWAKLSPNTSDLLEIAQAALAAGAEALTLTNTLLGIAIDAERRAPMLGAGGGGLSGDALHSVALRAVYDCRAAFPDAAIVGVGGVRDGAGAVRMLLAGADAVQVGTATLENPRAAARVQAELASWCARHRVAAVHELVGAANNVVRLAGRR
ncbi:MAG TPA: dihydroorotate dehydrogenase [Acidimicrobiales bacterium]|nr:dihydroorotate dehydrogenase [Acidimicrobiales bacterium]